MIEVCLCFFALLSSFISKPEHLALSEGVISEGSAHVPMYGTVGPCWAIRFSQIIKGNPRGKQAVIFGRTVDLDLILISKCCLYCD